MHFRSNKKNNKNISINKPIGFDKDGNEISFIDVIKTPTPDFNEEIHIKNNVNLLKTRIIRFDPCFTFHLYHYTYLIFYIISYITLHE